MGFWCYRHEQAKRNCAECEDDRKFFGCLGFVLLWAISLAIARYAFR